MKVLKNKKGYTSIISTIFLVIFLLIGVFSINVYVYIESYSQMKKEVSTLSDIVAKKGGLPEVEINAFKDRLIKYSYMADKIDKVEITAVTDKSDMDCLNTADLGDESGTYISTKDDENIILTVKTPANISNVLSYLIDEYSLQKLNNTYTYDNKIVSKREKPIVVEKVTAEENPVIETTTTTP